MASLSYRLYQIGQEVDEGSTNLTDTGTDLASTLDDFNTGNSTYWKVDVGDASQLPQKEYFYAYIGNEIVAAAPASQISGISGNVMIIWARGLFGSKKQAHTSGEDVFKFDSDPSNLLLSDVYVLDEITNFDVENVSKIQETIEHEKGEFRLSNVSVTVSEVGRHRLSDAGSIQKPWVFEVYDSSDNLVFQGFVRDNVKYNAETRKVSFQAVSWLDILQRAGTITARTVYEAEVVNDKRLQPDQPETSKIAVDIREDSRFTSGFPDRGDTAAIETGKGELREIIVASRVINNNNIRRLELLARDKFEQTEYVSKGDSNPKVYFRSLGGVLNGNAIKYRAYFTQNSEAQQVIENIDDKEGYYIVTFDSDDDVVQRIPISKKSVKENTVALETGESGWPKIFKAEVVSVNAPADNLKSHSYFAITKNPGSLSTLEKFGEVEQGDTIRILSEEAYGYGGEQGANGLPEEYKPSTLIDALFTVNDLSAGEPILGILPKIYNSTTYDQGSQTDTWERIDPRVEFPEKPIESLRMIQQTTGLLLVEETSTQQNANSKDVPQVSYKLRPRDLAFDNSNEVTLEDVKTWKETVTEDTLEAVVVETNKQYAGGGEVTKVAGWFYDSIEQDASTDKPKYTGKPEGENVITIQTNLYPSHEGQRYSGQGEEIRNDERLKALAREFYHHFKNANRKVQFTVAKDNPVKLGKYAELLNEGQVIDDRVLITSKSHDAREDYLETTYQGRIGNRAFDPFKPPKIPGIGGVSVFNANSNDEVAVTLSGLEAFDTLGGSLSYQWKYRVKGSTTSWDLANSSVKDGGTDATFENTFTGVTAYKQYEVRLEVTNSSTNQTKVKEQTIVLQPHEPQAARENYSNEVDYDKTQNTQSNQRYGRITLDPKNPAIIDRANSDPLVEYRVAKGKELEQNVSSYAIQAVDKASDVFTVPGDLTSDPEFSVGSEIFVNGSTGNDREYTVASTSYDSNNDETDISVNEDVTDGTADGKIYDGSPWIQIGQSSDPTYVNSAINTANGQPNTLYVETQLAKKHVSNIQTRITWVSESGFSKQVRTHAFDFDTLAEMRTINVYTNSDGELKVDFGFDEDTDQVKVEYSINGGSFSEAQNSKFPSEQTAETINDSNGNIVTLSNGDFADVRFTPENANDVTGPVETRRTYRGQTSGNPTFDTVTIAGSPSYTLDENGVFVNTSNVETLNFRNKGSGSLTLEEDGTILMKNFGVVGDSGSTTIKNNQDLTIKGASNSGISTNIPSNSNTVEIDLSSSALMSFTVADDQAGNNPATSVVNDGNTLEFIGSSIITTTVDPSGSNPEVEFGIAANSIGSGSIAKNAITDSELDETITYAIDISGTAADADFLDGLNGTHYESTIEVSDGTNVETLSEYKSGESFPSRLRVQSSDGSIGIVVDPSSDPATLDLTQSGIVSHSLDDHTNTSILGDPSNVDAGHLIFTDGTNWISATGPTSPTDAQVAMWDETDQKYRFVSFGNGLTADPDSTIGIASGGVTDNELDETITYDIDITGSAGDADTLDGNQGSHYETTWELKAAGGTTATVSQYLSGTAHDRVRVESSDSNIGISVTEGDPNVLDLTLASSAFMSFTVADDQAGNNPATSPINDGDVLEFIGDGNVTTTIDPSGSNPEVELGIASNSIGVGEVTSDIAILTQNATWTNGGIEVQGKQAASTLPDTDNQYAYIADDQTGVFHATGGGLVAAYKIHVQDGHGRVNHLWNVDESSGTYEYETGSEAAQNIKFGVDIFEIRMGPASNATAGNAISWNTAIHVNDTGQVGLAGATSLSSAAEIAGNLDMRSNNISNVNTVDGVDVSTHAGRHQETGSDTINAVPLGDPNGTSGQFLQSTGGNGTQWGDALTQTEADDLYLKRVDADFTSGSYSPTWDLKLVVQDESGTQGIIYAESVTT